MKNSNFFKSTFPVSIRMFYVSLWATLLFFVYSCSNGKKYDITNHGNSVDSVFAKNDSLLSAVPVIDTPVTTVPMNTVTKPLPVTTQLQAAADSIVETIAEARNPTTIHPKSDIETNDFKYQYVAGKFSDINALISHDTQKVSINETLKNGVTVRNEYVKTPPITITQGTKSRTETFTLKDAQGNSYPTAFFYIGQEETPWAVRLPKRILFRRMPRPFELKEILRNGQQLAPKPCPCTQFHTVEKGTVANGIAAYRKLSLEQLQKLNAGVKLTELKVGQKLCIAKKCKY